MRQITLQEFRPSDVQLDERDAALIASAFKHQIDIAPTSTPNVFRLTPGAFVGTVRLPGCTLAIVPKVPVSNLFWMLSFAHDLADFTMPDIALAQDEDIFEFVVRIFAMKVFDLVRQGLGRGYVDREENLPTIRGRVCVLQDLRRNCAIKSRVYCRHVEYTEDIIENRILKLCCYLLLRHPFRDQQTVVALRSSLLRFEGVSLVAIEDSEIDSLLFTRLNQRYIGCISLARLLLRNMSLSERAGHFGFSSFLINMNSLFERFFTALIRPAVEAAGGTLRVQHPIDITQSGLGAIRGRADIMVERDDGKTAILDTKYKDPGMHRWVIEDVFQVGGYCVASQSSIGILVYASPEEWQWEKRMSHSNVTLMGISVPLDRTRKEITHRIGTIGCIVAGQPCC